MKKRLLSILLCIMLCLSLMPTAVFADWIEDAEQCELCNGWDEGDNICDECGCHMNDICADWTHCLECGACFVEIYDFCTECGLCVDCYQTSTEHCLICGEHVGDTCPDCLSCDSCASEMHWHCEECGECMGADNNSPCPDHGLDGGHCFYCSYLCYSCDKCFIDDPDSYCEDCISCVECAIAAGRHCGICEGCADGELCDQCGMCPDCALEYEMHCPECGECVNGEFCLDGGEHCQNCCEICEFCGRCVEANGLDICSDCGSCEECCEQLSMDEGCDSGEVCVASAEWDEHFCEECGLCFCAADPCEECGLCVECCAAASMDGGCSTGEVCPESSEWDAHFCDDCGTCFCEIDWCDYCGLCTDCCEGNSECGDGMCAEDPDYGDHFCSVCGQCFHDVDQCLSCEEDGKIVCLDCCTQASHSAPVVNKEAPQILRQPKDYSGRASIGSEDYYAMFSVKLKNPDGAVYQWQRSFNHLNWADLSEAYMFAYGVNTDTLKAFVDEDSCDPNAHYLYRCKITNAYGTTYSDVVELKSHHTYTYDMNEYDEEYHGTMCKTCGLFTDDLEPHRFTAWKVTKEATAAATGLRERSCTGCEYKETEVIPKIHVHTFSTTYSKDDHYHWYKCTTSGCAEVSGKALHELGDLVVTKPATQTSSGSGYRACKICGMKVYEDIPKLPHTHDFMADPYASIHYDDIDDNGYVKYKTYNEFGHWKICKTCVTGNDATGYTGTKYDYEKHDFHEWEIDYSAGTITHKCKFCPYERVLEIPDTVTDDQVFAYTTKGGSMLLNGDPVGDHCWAREGDVIMVYANTYEGGEFKEWGYGPYVDVYDQTGKKMYFKTSLYNIGALDPAFRYQDFIVYRVVNVRLLDYVKDGKHYDLRYGDYICFFPNYDYCRHENAAIDPGTEIPATCTSNGRSAAKVCPDCGYVWTETYKTIPCHGHDYQLDQSSVIAPTCTKTGYTGNMVCTHCGDTVRGERVAKLEHTYGETKVITAPTCHSLGLEGKVCSECGYVLRGDRIDRTAHTESGWIVDSVGHMTKCTDPDCGALIEKKAVHTDANKDGKCDVCGYDPSAVATYTVTVKNDGNGSASADKTSAAKGKTVTLTATPKTGFVFKEWQSSDVTVSGNKFTMPEKNVTVKAVFAAGTPKTYTLSFVTNGGSQVKDVSAPAGTDVYLWDYETEKEGYLFAGWFIDKDLSEKADTVTVDKDMTFYAKWKKAEETKTTPFTDVEKTAYYYDAVVWAFNAEPQITDGNGKDKFMPDQTCTRAQVITFLWRAAGCPEPKTKTNPFKDVPEGEYYYKPVLWGVENGIVQGTTATTYNPYGICKNNAILTFIWRAMDRPMGTGVDEDGLDWYKDALNWAQKTGLLDGTYKGTFNVNAECPRCNVVQYLYVYTMSK